MNKMKKRNLVTFIKGIILMQLFLVIIIVGVTYDFDISKLKTAQLTALTLPAARVTIDEQSASQLLAQSSVSLAAVQNDTSWRTYWSRRAPEDMMVSNLRMLASRGTVPRYSRTSENTEQVKPVSDPEASNISNQYAEILKDHSVVFYCTHSAETYIPDSGQARLEGKRGLVNDVAGILARNMEKGGAAAECIDTMHDCPDYNQSYTRSRETVKSVIQSHADLLALFDIHRDSIPGQEEGETINVDGKPCARILIIVGTNERKPHPYWRENLAFAEKISKTAEAMYPGLIKGIKTKAGTYNQEYYSHALLLEFGSDRNSYKEVQYAADLFSEVLLKVLSEETD